MNAWPLSHEKVAVVARITPAAKTAGSEIFTDVIDMRYWQEVLFVVNLGAYAAGNDGTVTVKAVVNSTSSTSGGTDLSGKALTVGSFSGSALDDAVGLIRVRADECMVSGTEYRYLYLSVTPANQNMTLGVVALGFGARYQPASDYDIAAVKQIVP